jgi:hypothetical protein
MARTTEDVVRTLRREGLLTLVDELAAQHRVLRHLVLGRSRILPAIAARRALCRALRAKHLSYPEIGALLDRDHTSVMSLVKGKDRPLVGRARRSDRARCASCGEPFDDHLAKPPYALPKRECSGFVGIRKAG